MSYFRTVAGTAVLACIAAIALSVGSAGAADPGWTDGSEDYTGQEFCIPLTGEVCGPDGLGPPPEAPHVETIGGVSNLCIDPPTYTYTTYHHATNGVGQPSITFPYDPQQATTFHGLPHVCIPIDPPFCPEGGTEDLVDVWLATWNIGAGQSTALTVTTDCTPEVPVVPEGDPGVPVDVADPAPVVTAETSPPPPLPATGSETTLAAIGTVLTAVGVTLHRRNRRPSTAGLLP